MTRRILTALALTAPLLAAACGSIADPAAPRQVGFVALRTASTGDDGYWPDHFPERIAAPEQVRAGETFTATITTLGASGCYEPVSAEVQMTVARAVVTPYDRDRGVAGYACTGALKALSRDVSLRFDTPGTAVIQLRGRVLNGVTDEPVISYEHTVRVVE